MDTLTSGKLAVQSNTRTGRSLSCGIAKAEKSMIRQAVAVPFDGRDRAADRIVLAHDGQEPGKAEK